MSRARQRLPLEPLETWMSFPVQWSGTVVDAEIQDYTTYVSDNGGVFTIWLTNSTRTSTRGAVGHIYGLLERRAATVRNRDED